MSDAPQPPTEAQARAAVADALRLASIALPHLAGLAREVRVAVDARAETAGVFASGRLVVNPAWFCALAREDAMFVVAHELLHLALGTHERARGSDARLFNEAHDYIINDMLEVALERPAPAGGRRWYGARGESAEHLARLLRAWDRGDTARSWGGSGAPPADTPLGAALRAAGLAAPGGHPAGGSDVLPDELERAWFPDSAPADAARRVHVRRAATKAAGLDLLLDRIRLADPADAGACGDATAMQQALRTHYRPPWELALQQWLEAVAPGPRSYARPSRRGADRTDVVLAGRRREGWTLHIVLDTSGSMEDSFPRVLGTIAAFCQAANVAAVRILQCDTDVTADQMVTPEDLARFQVTGYGGSDMSPALARLARDPEVAAAVVITDGHISYPPHPMPCAVLWALTDPNEDFAPPYGRVIRDA